LRSLSFENNGLVKPSCGTVALYGPFGFFLRYGGLSMNNLFFFFFFSYNEQRLNIVEFKHKIMWYRSLEQYISKKNNTILAFEKLWIPLQYIFN
jgi:hypothetical protein